NVIQDDVGDMPVAWGARMLYLPESATWGADHQVKMVWLVNALVDTCDTSTLVDNDEYDTHCADPDNWSSETQVIQTYYEDFHVTSLSVREDHGMQAAVIAQTDALTAVYEEYLWHLADTLQQTFIAGELIDTTGDEIGDVRFDLAEIETRFDDDSPTYADGAPERWGIPKSALDVSAVYTYPDQISGLDGVAAVQVPAALAQYTSPAADARVTLLLAREETFRSTSLGGDGVTANYDGSISVDMSEQITQTYASLNWSPYVYDGYDWDVDDLGDTLA
ncbi:MAG: hypothetical protein GY832_32175, partial [Chloroflexi bacterium]|nr:hypothetical protein [Chloroflexota bacterium]